MRKFLVLSIALTAIGGRVFAQSTKWVAVDSSISDGPLVFTTNDSGFIGGNSDLYLSVTGGKNFESRALPSATSGATIEDMCWPTSQHGYLAFSTSGNSTLLVRTNNAGTTWNISYPPSNLPISNISFPTPAVGYVTGQLSPSPGYFVAKSTDSGSSWNLVYQSTFRIGPIHFKTATEGIFTVFNGANVPQVFYTFDGMSHAAMSKDTIPFNLQGQQSTFVNWNDDGSWIVQYQGLQRSTDSGKSWNLVLPDDQAGTTYGSISSACFHGDRGFAFADNSAFFETQDFGATWTSGSTDPYATGFGTFCSMPSSTVAYTTGSNGSMSVLLKLELPAEGGGVVETQTRASEDFHVFVNGPSILFTANTSAENRTIEILDVLGRERATVPLAGISTSTTLLRNALPIGSYFARLGNSIVKFALW